MDRVKIIKHLYLGSNSAHILAQFFKHVVGVVYVYTGIEAVEKKPFIHIAFDDIETTLQKLTDIYISMARGGGDEEIIIYANNYDNEYISLIIQANRQKGIKNILQKTLTEFSSHNLVNVGNDNIVTYLAYKDEIHMKASTKEGVINELNNTKKAMLNLLEDAYESQDKILAQADSLSKTLAESQKFAKKAEEERANYLLLISSIGEGIIVLDSEGKISIVNSACLTLLKTEREDMNGKKLLEILSIKDRQNIDITEEMVSSILTTDRTLKLPPFYITRNDGTTLAVSCTASPVKNIQTNEHVGIIITFRDIGEELALEDARINFISTASHQLRTPLTTMRWFIEMLYNGDAGIVNGEQHQYLDEINQGVERMANLVNYLLRTARVESDRTTIEPTNVLIRTVVEACREKLKIFLNERKQTIRITGDDIPEILLDLEYISEVFFNILKNASLYGKEGDEIIVDKKIYDTYATVSITDHGIGIEPEDQKRIFDKFFRAEKAIISSPDGTGLGLAFAKTLVKEWDGDITFTSVPNEYTTFTVTIPLKGMKPREGEVKLTD